MIVIDNTPPKLLGLTVPTPDHEDKNGKEPKNWYKAYNKIKFGASDSGDVSSEIEILAININSNITDVNIQEVMQAEGFTEYEVIKALESNEMYLSFVADSKNNQKFTVYLCYEYASGYTLEIPLYDGNSLSLDKEGKMQIFITAKDYAGNRNDDKKDNNTEIYIDNNKPEVEGHFTAGDAHVTSFGTFANHIINIEVPISDDADGIPSSGYKSAILEFANQKYEAEKIENNKAYFSIPKSAVEDNSLIEGELSINVTDNAGNASGDVALKSEKNSDVVIIERIKPVMTLL